ALCGITDFSAQGEGGQIHLLRRGRLDVIQPGRAALRVNVPSVLFYPRSMARRFVADPEHGADLVCAELHFEGGSANQVAGSLPDVICLPLEGIDGADQVLTLLFNEAFGDHCGRRALIDRLFEVVLIQMLRHLMETGQMAGGMLAGLSHPKLRKVLVAMHEQPGRGWSLEALAGLAGMSRSVFAATFRRVVGCTPGVYLQGWRVSLAQRALQQGRQLKTIAVEVGYGSEAALSRAFKAQCGMTPREWRQMWDGDSSQYV
ncbi:MAG TPA: cupin domain-containing protein, partial [Xylella taiwanensis]